MNYFELFGIPVQLKVEPGSLRAKYFELSRKYHPDHHAGVSPAVQAEVLEQSALLNKAYKTLQSSD
jgi:molecular chaperone HscB